MRDPRGRTDGHPPGAPLRAQCTGSATCALPSSKNPYSPTEGKAKRGARAMLAPCRPPGGTDRVPARWRAGQQGVLPRPLALGVREQGSPVLCSGRRARERASPWPVGSCAAPCAPARVRRQSVSMSVPLAPSRAPPGAARWLANAAAPTTTARDAAGDDAATHPPDVTRSRPCPSTSVATEHGHGSAPRTAVRDAGAPIGRLLIYLPQPLRSSAGRPAPALE